MTRYCAQCGSGLDVAALYAGYCFTCGTAIDTAEPELLGLSEIASADTPTRSMAGTEIGEGKAGAAAPAVGGAGTSGDTAGAHAGNASADGATAHRHARHQRPPAIWAFPLLAAIILLLTGAAIYALAQRGTISILLAPFTSSSAQASSHSVSSSSGGGVPSGSGTATVPSGAPTATPVPGGSPTPTPTPTPSSTATVPPAATATPTAPDLSVSPTHFTFTACLLVNRAQFTIANTGGAPLSWSASPGSSGYTLSLTSGSLAPGQSMTVTVSNILLNGIVTVSAPGAQNAPQQVTIMCTV